MLNVLIPLILTTAIFKRSLLETIDKYIKGLASFANKTVVNYTEEKKSMNLQRKKKPFFSSVKCLINAKKVYDYAKNGKTFFKYFADS